MPRVWPTLRVVLVSPHWVRRHPCPRTQRAAGNDILAAHAPKGAGISVELFGQGVWAAEELPSVWTGGPSSPCLSQPQRSDGV